MGIEIESIPLGHIIPDSKVATAAIIDFKYMRRLSRINKQKGVTTHGEVQTLDDSITHLDQNRIEGGNMPAYSLLNNDAHWDTAQRLSIAAGEQESWSGQSYATIPKVKVDRIDISQSSYIKHIRKLVGAKRVVLNSEADALAHMSSYKNTVVTSNIKTLLSAIPEINNEESPEITGLQLEIAAFTSAILTGAFSDPNQKEWLLYKFQDIELEADLPHPKAPIADVIAKVRKFQNSDNNFITTIQGTGRELSRLLNEKRHYFHEAARYRSNELCYTNILGSSEGTSRRENLSKKETATKDLDTSYNKFESFLYEKIQSGLIDEFDRQIIIDQYALLIACESQKIAELICNIFISPNIDEPTLLNAAAECDELNDSPLLIEYLYLIGIYNAEDYIIARQRLGKSIPNTELESEPVV
jgi:hypothetical protein